MFCLKKKSCFPSIRSLTVCINVKKCFLSTIKLLKVTCAVYLLTALPGHPLSEWLVAEAALCLLTSLDQRLTATVEQWVGGVWGHFISPSSLSGEWLSGCGPPVKPLSSEGCFAPTAVWFASFLLPFQSSGCISLLLLALVQRVVSDSSDCIVHGILQARILDWVAFCFSRASSHPTDQTQVSCVAGGFFTSWDTRVLMWTLLVSRLEWAICLDCDPAKYSTSGHLASAPTKCSRCGELNIIFHSFCVWGEKSVSCFWSFTLPFSPGRILNF